MQEFPFSKALRSEAESLIEQGKVGNVFFSEGTYQIEVKEPKTKKSFWPFLQFSDDGKLLDSFCTCPAAEKKKACEHLAASYLIIFNAKAEPLHVRFRDSLWNQLCLIASHRHGYDANSLKKEDKTGYFAASSTGKKLFAIRPIGKKAKDRLEDLLFNRAEETEETSLKFSNLPPEELALWKEGRPSHQLRYELSFWSDLAKLWMLLQEQKEEYTIAFSQGGEGGLPQWISVSFAEWEFGFYVAGVNWNVVIPALATVESPLAVHEFAHERIQKIRYDEQEKALILDFEGENELGEKPEAVELPKEEIGDWIFIPGGGFYPSRIDPIFKEKKIPQNKISLLLQKHQKVVQKYLENTKINRGGVKAQYEIYFNGEASLHLLCYVFEKGDLQQTESAYFGPWVYLPQKGFFLLEGLQFDGVEKIIPASKVSDFVNRHRTWLHTFEGFHTHVSTVESQLNFTVTKDKALRFETKHEFAGEGEEILDFGEWIYVKGRGFYSKIPHRFGAALKAGMKVPGPEISRFIHTHKDELEHIAGFFSSDQPLEKTGLSLTLNEEGRIVVRPEYYYKAEYASSEVHFFGDYTYVEGEGFCEVAPEFRLPEQYLKEKVVDLAQEPYFVAYEIDLLAPFLLTVDPRLAKPKDLTLHIKKVKKDEKAKAGEWIVELNYETEHGSVEAGEIWEAMNENKRYIFSKAGLILLRHPRFNWLKGLSKRRWLQKGKQLRLTTLEWIRLTVFEDIREPAGKGVEAVETRKIIDDFKSLQTDVPLDLSGLKSDLRIYQETGVKWLWFLYCHGLSGLLCDEMGLGKTHQAMGLLAAVENIQPKEEKNGLKYLVVCPTSVIYHWEELLKRFLPNMRVGVYYGIQRRKEAFETGTDLLLTSYGVLRSEKQALSEYSFEVAIFDEMQIAKNTASQTHKALSSIASKMRLGLSGTPIENRLLELKSLFDIILPSYFPVESHFKELFINPIEKNGDPEKKALLARLIKPFILRRKKTEVLLELPEKTEEIAYCDLSAEQKELYRKTFDSHKESLMRELQTPSEAGAPLMHVFALFSSLKQICDHPCLISKNPEEYALHHSGKWDLFVELLEETRDSGQKLVVFSQYLIMLDIIEAYLKEKNIGYAGIRGSTRNRKEQLERFREDPTCEVFVASLQAVGVGVDLVAASVVIHYDRWWNPAKENQATDRVHRIGQSRGVQVFKMVTKGTIEEHIHNLIEKKMALMEGVIGFDDQDQIKGLDREELIELLKLLNKDLEEKF